MWGVIVAIAAAGVWRSNEIKLWKQDGVSHRRAGENQAPARPPVQQTPCESLGAEQLQANFTFYEDVTTVTAEQLLLPQLPSAFPALSLCYKFDELIVIARCPYILWNSPWGRHECLNTYLVKIRQEHYPAISFGDIPYLASDTCCTADFKNKFPKWEDNAQSDLIV